MGNGLGCGEGALVALTVAAPTPCPVRGLTVVTTSFEIPTELWVTFAAPVAAVAETEALTMAATGGAGGRRGGWVALSLVSHVP